jgi:parallel beta-helix repeat protein
MLLHAAWAGLKDNNGAALAQGTVYVYERGTHTLVTLYADDPSDDSDPTPLANPFTCDDGGKKIVYLPDGQDVTIETFDSDGAAVDTIDSVGFAARTDAIRTTPAAGDNSTDGDIFDTANASATFAASYDSFGGRNWYFKHADAASTYERTFISKLSQVFDVRDFGANGTGGDDTAAVARAIAAMTSGDALYFPTGTYMVTSSQVFASLTGVRVFGDGMGSIVQQSGRFALFSLTGTCSRFQFENLRLLGDGTTGTTGAFGISMASTVTDVRISGCEFSGSADGSGFSVAVIASTRTRINDCYFRRCVASSTSICIKLDLADDVIVSDCHLICEDDATNRTHYGIACSSSEAGRVSLQNIHIYRPGTYGISLLGGDRSSIVNCNIEGQGTSGGIAVSGGADLRILNNIVTEGQDGIVLTTTELNGVVARAQVCMNNVSGQSRYGIHLATTWASNPCTACRVTDNIVYDVAMHGIYSQGASNCVIKDNLVYDGGSAAADTYDAIHVTTTNLAGHTGGGTNYVDGNYITEIDTQDYRTGLYLADHAGAVTNVASTVVGTNCLGAIGPSASLYQIGGTDNTAEGTPAMDTQMVFGTAAGGSIGMREEVAFADTPYSVSTRSSGRTFYIDASGGATTINLPTLTGYTERNGLRFYFYSSVASAGASIACNAADSFVVPGIGSSAGPITLTSAGGHAFMESHDGAWHVFAYLA